MNPQIKPALLTEQECAVYLGVSVATLRKDRLNARRFPYVKVGTLVRYPADKVLAAVTSNVIGGAQL